MKINYLCFPKECSVHRVQVLTARSVLILFALLGQVQADTFTVNSNTDSEDVNPGDGVCSTGIILLNPPELACTLRAAIQEANALAGSDTIEFSGRLPEVAGVVEIIPASRLPFISDTVLIDGYSHPDYDDTVAFLPAPIINLVGSNAGGASSGLVILQGAGSSQVRGLAISNFASDGILMIPLGAESGPSFVQIEGNFIGVRRSAFYSGNGRDGISILSSPNTSIGERCGPLIGCTGRGNVISGNSRHGVNLDSVSSAPNDGVRVAGNLIGTDRFGSSISPPFSPPTGNGEYGVRVTRGSVGGATGLEIGSLGLDIFSGGLPGDGSVVTAGNVISGNGKSGILIRGAESASIAANRIGTNLAGTVALPNGEFGIESNGAGGSTVIGLDGLGGNLISGNTSSGIFCTGLFVLPIVNNRIGVASDALSVLPNGGHGVDAECSVRLDENVIGGNSLSGARMTRSSGAEGNFIGTNAVGTDLGNSEYGLSLTGPFSAIGQSGLGNTIGFNGLDGIHAGSRDSTYEGNYIGTNENGDDLGNGGHGISSIGIRNEIGTINGLTNGAANTIGWNGGDGIHIPSNLSNGIPGSAILGNYIGTNAAGDVIGNEGSGIHNEARLYTIGAGELQPDNEVAQSANLIENNGGDGIRSLGGTETVFRGNLFRANEEEPIDLGPIAGPTPNDFGDTDTGPNNQQNTPEFDASLTSYDVVTGNVLVRYRVDSNLGDAAYPLKVDFFVRDPLLPEEQARAFIGSDTYPAVSASAFRSATITPLPGTVVENSLGFVSELIVATATDADGNTSELSTQLVPVPEPAAGALLSVGAVGLAFASRVRRGAKVGRGH